MFNLCYYSRSKHMFSEEQSKKAEDQMDRVKDFTSSDPGVSSAKEWPAVQKQMVIEYYS